MEKSKGRSESQSVKILFIKDFLCSRSDGENYITTQEIIDYLEEKEIRAEKKSIYADVRKLKEYYGLDVEITRGKGYRVHSKQFVPSDLRLMIDAIQSSRFITSEEAKDLTNQIKELADVHTRKTLERNALVVQRVQKRNTSVIRNTDTIYDAINNNHQISFKYVHYKPSMTVGEKKYSKNGEPYIVSPTVLYWDNGNCYLYAYLSDKNDFRAFRIDRMEAVKILGDLREPSAMNFKAKKLLGNKKVKKFSMFGGETKMVSIVAINKMADAIVDEFGTDLMMVPTDKDHFQVNVAVEISPTFFAWISTFGKQMKIIAPQSVVDDMKVFVSKLSEMYR